jgi:hypothetical protein
VCSAIAAPAGHAADRIYWANDGNDVFSFANLTGGGGDLGIAAGPSVNVQSPSGLSIDSATGRLFWGNYSNGARISFANFDGSGAANLNTTGALGPPDGGYAWGVALDPVGRRIYWANESMAPEAISFANLDGSGGGDVNTTGATVKGVEGVAVDPVAGRVYWANNTAPEKISFANLDGSGGGDLNTTGATVTGLDGVAVDPGGGRIYWGYGTGIAYAALDGSGGADLNTAGATVQDPTGLAVDPAGGRIYWANRAGNVISFAKLDGSGGGDLATPESTLSGPLFPVLLEAPSAAGPPAITGGRTTGARLSCSQGSWTPDLIPAFLYRAPHRFAFQWTRDAAPIAGATSNSIPASSPGDYGCRVTATNPAGAASQTSASHRVSVPSFGARTRVTIKLAARRIPAGGPLAVRVANANAFRVTGKLSAQTSDRISVARKVRIKLAARSFRIGARGKQTIRLKLPKPLRQVLAQQGKLKLRLTAKVTDPAGKTRTVRKRVTPRLAKKG